MMNVDFNFFFACFYIFHSLQWACIIIIIAGNLRKSFKGTLMKYTIHNSLICQVYLFWCPMLIFYKPQDKKLL